MIRKDWEARAVKRFGWGFPPGSGSLNLAQRNRAAGRDGNQLGHYWLDASTGLAGLEYGTTMRTTLRTGNKVR